MAKAGDSYTILYGKTDPPDTQVDGGDALQDGPMTVTIGNLDADTIYYFSDIVTRFGDPDCCSQTQSLPLPPITYSTTPGANLVELPTNQL